MTTKKRIDVQAGDQKRIAALEKHCPNETILLNGVTHTTDDLVTDYKAHVALLQSTESARVKWRRLIQEEHASSQNIARISTALRNFAANRFGEGSEEFADFGFTPRKVTKKTVAAKASAAQKSRATRAAHHAVDPKAHANGQGANSAPAPGG